jgi:Protein of unknown function (DUF1588)/Protein of unknown function (DUF1592)/Protein of unknown function (DUF1595)
VAPVSIRRLSSVQYANALRMVFPGPLGEAFVSRADYPSASPRSGLKTGFTTDADYSTVSTQEAMQIDVAAEAMADAFLANASTQLPQLCPKLKPQFTEADVDNAMPACVAQAGRRAFRRSLNAVEKSDIEQLYRTLRSTQSAAEAMSAVVQYLVQAPSFIYRPEKGEVGTGVVALTPLEFATRLSFLTTDGPPDDTLLSAAEDGALQSAVQRQEQTQRLLSLAAAKTVVGRFLSEWLRVDSLDAVSSASSGLSDAQSASMQSEPLAWSTFHFGPEKGSLEKLFGAREIPVATALQDLYGTTTPGTNVDPAALLNRRGILSSVSFLTAHAPKGHVTPILRGAFLRKEVLCQDLPAFPGTLDVDTPLQGSRNEPTARLRLAPTSTRPGCAGCHAQMNPLGFALEAYDDWGRHRTTENNTAIDTSGTISFDSERWDFADSDAFLGKVGQSALLKACAIRQYIRFAIGRAPAESESALLEALALDSTGDRGLRPLVLSLAASPLLNVLVKDP